MSSQSLFILLVLLTRPQTKCNTENSIIIHKYDNKQINTTNNKEVKLCWKE